MELFNEKGCLTDEGLHALIDGQLDELGRLEAAEHLAYCDRCIERYTVMLSNDCLHKPETSLAAPLMKRLWVSVMRNTLGRAAVAGVAAALALGMWGGGLFNTAVRPLEGSQLVIQPTEQSTSAASRFWDAYEDWFSQAGSFEFKLPFGTAGADSVAT